MAKIRAKYANIKAAAVACANNSLRGQLIGDSQPRSKGIEFVVDVSIQTDITKACYADGAHSIQIDNVGEATITLRIDSFGEVDLPAQAVVERELRRNAPSILPIEEPALLAFGGIVGRREVRVVDVPGKG